MNAPSLSHAPPVQQAEVAAPRQPLLDRLRPVAPVFTVVVLLLLWGLWVRVQGLPTHLFPPPDEVLARLWNGLAVARDMWPHLWATVRAAGWGYAMGALAAVFLAVLLASRPWLERMAAPLLAALQATPKTALAPMVLIWAGLGMKSIAILVALISFFPVFINTLIGLRAVDANLLDLYRACGASRLHTLLHLRLPTALPYLLTGLQVAVAFALVGCCVMEFLIGTEGMGYMIQDSANRLDAATGVAAMVLLGVVGALGSLALRALRKRWVFWEGPTPTQGGAA